MKKTGIFLKKCVVCKSKDDEYSRLQTSSSSTFYDTISTNSTVTTISDKTPSTSSESTAEKYKKK